MNMGFYIKAKHCFDKVKEGLEAGIVYKVDIMCEHGASGRYFSVKYDELKSVKDIFAIQDDLISKGINESSANYAMYNIAFNLKPSYDDIIGNIIETRGNVK